MMSLRLSLQTLATVSVWLCASVVSAEEQQLDLSAYVGSGDNLGAALPADERARINACRSQSCAELM